LFAGQEHENGVKRIAEHFQQNPLRYRTISFNSAIISELKRKNKKNNTSQLLQKPAFVERDLSEFSTDEEAYHQLMLDIIYQQFASTQLVLKGTDVKRIFVDGGFSKNAVYMNLLAGIFPQIEVYAASMAQATALGAAMAIHKAWNKNPLPNNIIQLQYYSLTHDPVL
jgi:sugar (pentulose or hexulose) kinase